jgi:betaine-aldehyde dehydrogenase
MTQIDAGAELAPRVTLPDTRLFVGGEWRDASDGGTFLLVNPATEERLGEAASATADDVDAAVQAARTQLERGAWARLSGSDRGRILYRIAELIERDNDLLGDIEALEVGKPAADPKMIDIPAAAETFRHFAGWADKIHGRQIPVPDFLGHERMVYTRREPIGVVAAITPWNAPTMIAAWKIAPALAAGCTIVIKPPEDAPLSTHHLAGLCREAGLPDGALNVVSGLGSVAGAALVRHPGVDKISFTGSSEVGREIATAAAQTFKRVTLELGGKSPQLFFADADLEAAIPVAAVSLFANQGEVCAAGTRILVDRRIRSEVVEGLAEEARKVRVGDPFDPETTMGALINESQLERVLGYIDAGVKEGAELVTGGNRLARRGYFVEPTVFLGSNDLSISREEIFGPVGTVIEYEDPDDAIALANETPYGLAAVIWTRDVSTAHATAARLKAGAVWVNAWGPPDPRLPWGGMKGSGVGRELGLSGLESYTEEKVVTVVL